MQHGGLSCLSASGRSGTGFSGNKDVPVKTSPVSEEDWRKGGSGTVPKPQAIVGPSAASKSVSEPLLGQVYVDRSLTQAYSVPRKGL